MAIDYGKIRDTARERLGAFRSQLSLFQAEVKGRGRKLKGLIRETWVCKQNELRTEWQEAKITWRSKPLERRTALTLLVVAIILGSGFKIAAAHTFTIGYDDYTVDKETKLVDLNNLQLPDPNEPLPAEKNSGPMCIEQ